MKTITSRDKALSVLNPPQNPVIKRVLYTESISLFVIKKVNTTDAIKHPRKLDVSVHNGKL
jgi:hypothetical protein